MTPLGCLVAVMLAAGADPAHQVATASGNGGLSAGWNRAGTLTVLRWPGPGGPNQISAPRAGVPGGQWGVELNGRTRWLDEMSDQDRAGGAYTVSGFVSSDPEVLIARIETTQSDPELKFVWRSSFAPTARQVPELSSLEHAVEVLHGFATVADPERGRVWYLRPDLPGQAELRRARELIAKDAPVSAWAESFESGVWIGVGPGREVRLDTSEPARSALGSVASMTLAAPNAEGAGSRGWIAIAVGTSYREVAAKLDTALQRMETGSGLRPEPALAPDRFDSAPTSERAALAHHWYTLRVLRDPRTGRVVRGLDSDPFLARDWPRYGVWIALAFDAWGDLEAAETVLNHYLDGVRTTEAPWQPYGSIPESFYTNGDLASPRFLVDDRGAARVLYAVERHARILSPEVRAAWLKRHALPIRAAGDFIASWFDSRRGAPLWSADPLGLSDAETQTRLFDQLAGIGAAIRLLAELNETIPAEWIARRDTLRDLAQWVVTTPSVGWSPASSVALDFEDWEPGSIARVQGSVERALTTPAVRRPAVDVARIALQAALLLDADGVDRARLSAVVESLVSASEREYAPDAFVSAMFLNASALVRNP